MNKTDGFAFRFAVYAALVALMGTLGGVMLHVGLSTPGI